MATQTKRSSSRRSNSRSSSRSGSGGGSSGTTRTRSSRTTRARSNGRQGSSRGSGGSSTRSRAKRSSRSAPSRTRQTASRLTSRTPDVGAATSKVGEIASKAKGPLLAGGAALAGLAGGIALNRRNNSRNPLRKMKAPSLPKVNLSKVDLDKLTDAAYRVRAFGEQVGDVADAAQETRKKHK
jgi:hypothetical protein